VKIGIFAGHFITWAGGVDFLGTVIDSLLSAPRAASAEFHLVIPDMAKPWTRARHQAKQRLRGLIARDSRGAPSASSATTVHEPFSEFRSRLSMHHVENQRPALTDAVTKLDLDIIVPAFYSLGADFPKAWVGYAYDFQHKYYPQLFTPENCRLRDGNFAEMLTTARAVIVNSRSVADDLAKFVSERTSKVFTLPFAPSPNDEWKEDQPDILSHYGVASPFFMISNQFWIHKDHTTAFEAFRSVAARRPDVSMVCTGATRDDRDPDYFPKLMDKVKAWGLKQRVHVLGLIPKRHQIEIMKNACAVLQPTRFEGGPGGGAIYDSVSLGVPSIVSDLAVNREIEDSSVEFFPVGDADKLAEKMEQRLAAPRIAVPWDSLAASGRSRRAACGHVLWQALEYVVD
jgi:glycosyltransferase involved in cell wall biosynthesis